MILLACLVQSELETKVGLPLINMQLAYLAVKYLHSRIVASGQSDGIKHMTTWMKNQFDTSQGASNSGIDDYFQTFNISKASGGNFSSNADFVSNYKGLDGQISFHNLDQTTIFLMQTLDLFWEVTRGEQLHSMHKFCCA